jgi:hypothetical protein
MRRHQSASGSPTQAIPGNVAPDSPPLDDSASARAAASSARTPLAGPDLAVSLRLDAHAPRAASQYVALVDRPSPDLRDAVMLLTGEFVTRALKQHPSVSGGALELRVWMPADVVRVELRAPRNLMPPPRVGDERRKDLPIEKLADRWSIDIDDHHWRAAFEIDRHPLGESDKHPLSEIDKHPLSAIPDP